MSVTNLIKSTNKSDTTQTTPFSFMNHIPTDNIYEIATRILFASVKWARDQSASFNLTFPDQLILLEESWIELFILTVAETKLVDNERKCLCLKLA